MTAAFALDATRPAYPLGKPADRDRYGMTHEMAAVYRWLVAHRPHDRPFNIQFHDTAEKLLKWPSKVHQNVQALVERGWLARDDAGYVFVQPVMRFKEAR